MIRLTTAHGLCADALRAAWPLHGSTSTRAIEQASAATLPPHTLMQRAGRAVARLALAVAPHAQRVWVACGPGNNGGDGLEAAIHLARHGKRVFVSWMGDADRAPADARMAWHRARTSPDAAAIEWCDAPPPLDAPDLAIDALLGTGPQRPPQGQMADWLQRIGEARHTVLCVDLPSGLDADTGAASHLPAWWATQPSHLRHTLSLLTLKPGLFTALGRDACGSIWLDDLGVSPGQAPDARLNSAHAAAPRRLHASHKGSHGDVAVIGGASGMEGAALLAAQAALQAGAGRVFVQALHPPQALCAPPDLMLRPWQGVPAADTVACGCGGGDAVRQALPVLLSRTPRLVLDADALNAIAADTALQLLLRARARRTDAQTVLTPHPLEAARLLGTDTLTVQDDRLTAASQLAQQWGACVVLKGSGSVIAAPGETPRINPSGNARLAIAGTGDVLAGLLAARWAHTGDAFEAACAAVWEHGRAAETAPADTTLTASALAKRLQAPP